MNKKRLGIVIVVVSVIIVVALSTTYIYFSGMVVTDNSNYELNHSDEVINDSDDMDFLNWAISDRSMLDVLADQVSYRFRYNIEPEEFINKLINTTTDRLEKYNEYTLLSPDVQKIKEKGLEVMSIFQHVGYLALSGNTDFFDEMETAKYHLKIWHDLMCANEKVICD